MIVSVPVAKSALANQALALSDIDHMNEAISKLGTRLQLKQIGMITPQSSSLAGTGSGNGLGVEALLGSIGAVVRSQSGALNSISESAVGKRVLSMSPYAQGALAVGLLTLLAMAFCLIAILSRQSSYRSVDRQSGLERDLILGTDVQE